MTITKDTIKAPFILREGFTADGGELEYTETLAPAILPMSAFELLDVEALQWVVSTKTRVGAIVKGGHYAVRAITNKGLLLLEDAAGKPIPGLFPMDYFARMIRQEGTFVTHLNTPPNATDPATGGGATTEGSSSRTGDQQPDGGKPPRRRA